MKKLILILSVMVFAGCEKIVNIDLKDAPPRLVIDASIIWQKGTTGNLQTIKLTTSTGYFQTQIPKVTGATVTITNSANTVFNFIEVSNTGNYVCNNFKPVLNERYTLTVTYNNQTYKADEVLTPTPEINEIEQRNDLGFNSDEIGIKINFNDFANQNNFYLFNFVVPSKVFPEYQVLDDQFNQGSKMSWLYSDTALKINDKLTLTLFGISKPYYNYMNIIIKNTGSGAGNPFQSPPANARGNILNLNNPNDFVYGYFSLSESDQKEYVIR
ncbi:MAG: DUF4249 domain-containing protein [Sphingobacteriia bacterium]|nr:DUF4249 domain-containing protein [Sphingobacteriia bacterium]